MTSLRNLGGVIHFRKARIDPLGLQRVVGADGSFLGARLKRLRPTRGFQSMKTAYATIKGFEIMRMIRRRHCILIEPGVTGEV
jgi:hypothetical protein